MPEMAQLRTRTRLTPFVTGCPIQTHASEVPFEEPAGFALTPSTEMSLIVLMVGVEEPYATSTLFVACSPTWVKSLKLSRFATSPVGLSANSPTPTAQFPWNVESSTCVLFPDTPHTFSSLVWNVVDGSVTLNTNPCTVAPPEP